MDIARVCASPKNDPSLARIESLHHDLRIIDVSGPGREQYQPAARQQLGPAMSLLLRGGVSRCNRLRLAPSGRHLREPRTTEIRCEHNRPGVTPAEPARKGSHQERD